jgi:ATP-dependent HslUV protease ATP-binding subunit HslU
VGKDVDTIIRDLMDVAVKAQRQLQIKRQRMRAEDAAEDRILDILVPPPRTGNEFGFSVAEPNATENTARQVMRKRLREGALDDKEIEIDIAEVRPTMEFLGPQGMEEVAEQIKAAFAQMNQGKRSAALSQVEQNGIVFIDEIDKVASRSEHGGAEVSRQGVQRDLLPLVEGTTVNTKYGMVRTDHILFIASGAFHLAKPSDLIPELQGRFPIRVELSSLSVDDFEAILTATHASLIKQYQALLATEGVTLNFQPDAVRRLAELAFQVNESTENIGARRLATVMERLLDEVSFDAPNRQDQTVLIDAAMVNARLAELARNEDLSRFIL